MLLVEHTELYLSATAVACITHGHGGRHLMCSIDELLGGGAFEGGLLELAGESSSGGPLRARPCCKIAALYSTSGLLCGWRNAASLSHGWLQDPLMLQKDSALSGQPYSFWLLLTYNSVTGHLANLFIPAPLSSNNGGTGNGPGTELPERAEHSILLRGSLEHTHTHTTRGMETCIRPFPSPSRCTGKTQLCLLATASAACMGEHVVYIDTTNSFSAPRLAQIISKLPVRVLLLLLLLLLSQQHCACNGGCGPYERHASNPFSCAVLCN